VWIDFTESVRDFSLKLIPNIVTIKCKILKVISNCASKRKTIFFNSHENKLTNLSKVLK